MSETTLEAAGQADVVLRARGLSKVYPIFDRPQDRLTQMFLRGRRRLYREFWAVRGVDLEVRQGETVGIIGRNGSGKSTLLQMLARTLQPSSGECWVKGRVSALLELGSGFDPQFTGRENVMLTGEILGLTRKEVAARYDSIVEFADIGVFIDQPVKSYSSGMYARLAFAVAIHVAPDVLIVDEALAVGDEAFQRKCYGRLAEMRREGVTILFVSHSAGTIVELCDRAVLMDQGESILVGEAKRVIRRYHDLVYATPERARAVRGEILAEFHSGGGEGGAEQMEVDVRTTSSGGGAAEAPRDGFDSSLVAATRAELERRGCCISAEMICIPGGGPVNILRPLGRYELRFRVQFERTISGVRFAWVVKAKTGVVLSGASTGHPGGRNRDMSAGELVEVVVPLTNIFGPGVFFVDIGVRGTGDTPDEFLHGINDAIMFRSLPAPGRYLPGYVDMTVDGAWEIRPAHVAGGAS